MPPYTVRTWPLTKDAASLARKRAAPAISCGCPQRSRSPMKGSPCEADTAVAVCAAAGSLRSVGEDSRRRRGRGLGLGFPEAPAKRKSSPLQEQASRGQGSSYGVIAELAEIAGLLRPLVSSSGAQQAAPPKFRETRFDFVSPEGNMKRLANLSPRKGFVRWPKKRSHLIGRHGTFAQSRSKRALPRSRFATSSPWLASITRQFCARPACSARTRHDGRSNRSNRGTHRGCCSPALKWRAKNG